MGAALVGIADALRIVDAMVGKEHHQRVRPLRRTAQTADEVADTVVEVGHGVGHLVTFDAVVGHNPRFVAGQSEEADMPRTVGRLAEDMLIERVEGYAVRHAPVMRAAHGRGERRIAVGAFVARAEQIAVGVGEVDVAAIEEFRGISRFAQRRGQ